MRILIISNLIPVPPNSGARIRQYQLFRRIAEKHDVGYACHVWNDEEEHEVGRLREMFHPVVTGRVRRSPRERLLPSMARDFFRGRPPALSLWRSSELEIGLRRLFYETEFDIVQIEETQMAPYIDLLPSKSKTRTVLSLHNVLFDQIESIGRISGSSALRRWHRLNARLCSRWEPRFAGRFDRCTTVSERDLALLLDAAPGLRAEVVPNGVDIDSCPTLAPPSGPPSFLFVGDMNYGPCVDAVKWFTSNIFPRVRSRFPGSRFWVVGREPKPELLSLEGEGVRVTGAVESVVPYYEKCCASVVPLRAGGGTRLKILESMAMRRPVISTTIGAEGLHVRDGEHLLIADDDDRFAEKVMSVVDDPDGAAAMAERARTLVETRYDWGEIAGRQLRVYDDLIEPNGDRS